MEDMEQAEELSKEEVLRMNQIRHRYSSEQIDQFIEQHMEEHRFTVQKESIHTSEDFEKLVLAYDRSTRKDSAFTAEVVGESIDNGQFIFPEIVFRPKKTKKRKLEEQGEEKQDD